ncbi:hypothetical protein SIL19_27995, partial [Bacillus cereus group sp. BfR-BA-00431]|uniref:hypothetical protein n=1 Tax=Bacillus cereus group sp. BfR-BA-00431 TaxID=3094868 RepID=UPI0029C51DDB
AQICLCSILNEGVGILHVLIYGITGVRFNGDCKRTKIFYIFSLVKDNDFLFILNEMRNSEKIV